MPGTITQLTNTLKTIVVLFDSKLNWQIQTANAISKAKNNSLPLDS